VDDGHTVSLPDAASVLHYQFRFRGVGALGTGLVKPDAGDTVELSGGAMSAGEGFHLAKGSSLSLIASAADSWLSRAEAGTITEETP